jgi:hydrogenase-4 component B
MNYLLPSLAFLPMLAALFMPILGEKHALWRNRLMQIATFFTFTLSLLLPQFSQAVTLPGWVGMGLHFSAESLQIVLAVLASFVFLLSALSSPAYFRGNPHVTRYAFFFLLTQGALLGVFLAADFFTLFIFFEIMSFTSWVWVAQNETMKSSKAAYTYLAIAVGGGMVLLFGLMLLQSQLHTLNFHELHHAIEHADPQVVFLAAVYLLVGFGAKAGLFPLHIWLPKAHPEAPAPASALLSGILTKSGVFGVILLALYVMPGNEAFALLLLVLGTVTMLLGAILALLSDDLKRTLACSSLSQIGFIMVAVSLIAANHDTTLASGGALLHVVNHALTKLVLFVSAGVIYKTYHTNDLNHLRGAGRGSWLLMACFLVGGLSLAGIPGLAGYMSKTLIHEAIVENMHVWQNSLLSFVENLFLLSGGLTLAYMTKLFVILFVQKPVLHDDDHRHGIVKPDLATGFAIGFAAFGLVLFGALPDLFYSELLHYTADFFHVHPHAIHWFSWVNLKGALTSIGIGILIYILIVRLVLTSRDGKASVRTTPIWIDLEQHFYLPVIQVLVFVGALLARLFHSASGGLLTLIEENLLHNRHPFITEGTDDHFALYSRGYVSPSKYAQTLALELMLFGIGLIITLFYQLIVNAGSI